MKTISIILLIMTCVVTSSHADWHSDYDSLLRKYVTPTGVKYKAWAANAEDVKKLHSVTDAIATQAPSGDYNAKLAFHLNAYNAWILRAVIDHYPVKSIKDIKLLVFKRYNITVSGQKMSFSALENKVIRKNFKEPRIHFALNCASKSCPPLYNRAFHGNTLGRALKKLTRDFVNSPNGVKVSEGTNHISKIFDWYKEDFGNVSEYINQHRKDKISGKIKYQDYDWSLNESR